MVADLITFTYLAQTSSDTFYSKSIIIIEEKENHIDSEVSLPTFNLSRVI